MIVYAQIPSPSRIFSLHYLTFYGKSFLSFFIIPMPEENTFEKNNSEDHIKERVVKIYDTLDKIVLHMRHGVFQKIHHLFQYELQNLFQVPEVLLEEIDDYLHLTSKELLHRIIDPIAHTIEKKEQSTKEDFSIAESELLFTEEQIQYYHSFILNAAGIFFQKHLVHNVTSTKHYISHSPEVQNTLLAQQKTKNTLDTLLHSLNYFLQGTLLFVDIIKPHQLLPTDLTGILQDATNLQNTLLDARKQFTNEQYYYEQEIHLADLYFESQLHLIAKPEDQISYHNNLLSHTKRYVHHDKYAQKISSFKEDIIHLEERYLQYKESLESDFLQHFNTHITLEFFSYYIRWKVLENSMTETLDTIKENINYLAVGATTIPTPHKEHIAMILGEKSMELAHFYDDLQNISTQIRSVFASQKVTPEKTEFSCITIKKLLDTYKKHLTELEAMQGDLFIVKEQISTAQ